MEGRRDPTELKVTAIGAVAATLVAALLLALGWIGAGAFLVLSFLLCVFVWLQVYTYVRLGMGFVRANLLIAIDPEFRRSARRKLQPGISRQPPEWSRSKKP